VWLSVGILVGSLFLLTLGAEALVRGAAGIARSLGVSSFFIGLTIVGFGTSTPELATGLSAAWSGNPDINIGNVVGSNIFNIAVILGVTALLCPIPVRLEVVRRETLLVIAVAFIPLLAALGGSLQRWEGALMVAGLVWFVHRGYRAGRREAREESERLERELESELGIRADRPRMGLRLAQIVAGLALLVVGARFLTSSAVDIARTLGVSELVIALTIVAAGTSAPELVTSLVAAVRKQSDISVGNILGSNIFNVLGILGITTTVAPQRVNQQVLWLDTPVMLLASIALLPIMTSQARISRAEGACLLVGYAAYLTVLFTLAPGWFSAAAPTMTP